jgi:DNA-binding HxlR family transcriptional regulator
VKESAERVVVDVDCPPRRIHALFNAKWTSMTLYVLSFGKSRTGELLRSMPGISKKMLTQTLRELERDGLVERKVYHVIPPMVEYALTPLGHKFTEPLIELYGWAKANAAALDQIEINRLDFGTNMLVPETERED